MAALYLLFIFLVSILHHTSALNRTCKSHRECKNEHITCNSDPYCSIQCLGSNSCEGAIIDCSNASTSICSLNCTEALSCEGVTIKCPPNGLCNIDCRGEQDYMCSDIQIISASNTITNINCLGNKACQAATIMCGNSTECNLDCYGPSACGERGSPLRIFGNTTSSLKISRCTGGLQVCEDMNVHCPSNINGVPRCFVPGGGIFNERESLSGGREGIVAGGIHLYALQTWNDINITDYSSNNLISGSMNCGPDHHISCPITNVMDSAVWDCNQTNSSLCARAMYHEPTVEPTIEPTLDPTLDPTSDPTKDPTMDPTTDPTGDPTVNPTIQPTTPTFAPTTDPTIEPTAEPTDEPTQSPVPSLGREGGGEDIHFGIYVGGLIAVIFVIGICCGWRWWRRGRDVVVMVGGDTEMLSDDKTDGNSNSNSKGKSKGKKKKKKKRKEGKEALNGVDTENGDEMMDREKAVGGGGMVGPGNTDSVKEEVIEVMVENGGMNGTVGASGKDGGTKKKKKKKKKKKRKKQKEENDGDYKKQMDDPFETNDWTELTEFD